MRILFAFLLIAFVMVPLLAPAYAQDFDLRDSNPIKGVDDLGGVVKKISDSLFGIAVPIAALMYIYAGIRMMLSRGKPEGYREAGKIILYTSIGLAIILIGEGFVSLIKSIIALGG